MKPLIDGHAPSAHGQFDKAAIKRLSGEGVFPTGLQQHANFKKAFLHINTSELTAICHFYWEVL